MAKSKRSGKSPADRVAKAQRLAQAKRKEEESKDNGIFAIDMNMLEQEWVDQPLLFIKYARMLADAKLNVEEEKAAMDALSAELDQSIRENPEDYDVSKVTENGIKAVIQNQPEYKAKHRKVIRAKHRVDVLSAYVTALEHRKRALEKLVDLHGQQYFSKPVASEDTRERMREVETRSERRKGVRRK